MKTPYQLLEITTKANDDEIKQAYLRKVKAYPPDREPEQFQLIHNAYELIKDKKSRISYDLFTPPTADFDELINQALKPQEKMQLNADHFIKLLSASIDDTTIQKAIPKSEQL